MNSNRVKALSVFSLVMLTIVSVDSIRNLPTTALFGTSLIFFFILGAIFFLIPSAMVSAELSSGWPKQGGIYVWVKTAFGDKFGFLAIWFQWIENVIWYPTILSFVAGTVGYLLAPSLAANKFFLIAVILVAFWGATLLNLYGMRASAWFSNLCAIFGLLIPMTLIITLGTIWTLTGKHLQLHFSAHALLPNLHEPQTWVALTGIILSFCGMEIATVHARDVNNPQHSFPKALIISVVILIMTLALGSLAIAIVLPEKQISLVAGIMQAFNAFFNVYHAHWIMPVVALMLILGGMGSVSNWIIAPTKGLLVAAEDGHLPKHFEKENRHGAPKHLLLYQAIIVTLLVTVFLFMPTVNGSYWFLTVLAAELYMFMYLLMFAAGIYLRLKHPEQERPFKIPGGKLGMPIIATIGIIGALTTIAIGFIPPANINVGAGFNYDLLLIGGLIIMSLPPFIFYHLKKRR